MIDSRNPKIIIKDIYSLLMLEEEDLYNFNKNKLSTNYYDFLKLKKELYKSLDNYKDKNRKVHYDKTFNILRRIYKKYEKEYSNEKFKVKLFIVNLIIILVNSMEKNYKHCFSALKIYYDFLPYDLIDYISLRK